MAVRIVLPVPRRKVSPACPVLPESFSLDKERPPVKSVLPATSPLLQAPPPAQNVLTEPTQMLIKQNALPVKQENNLTQIKMAVKLVLPVNI